MPSGIQTSPTTPIIALSSLHPGVLVQDVHHRSLLLFVLDQHAASATDVFDDIDNLAEAGGSAARLGEAREAQVGAAPVFEYDEEFDDEGDGLDFKI